LLAECLQLEETEVLVPTVEEQLNKLAVYVPVDHAADVRNAIGNAGAGFIGEYSHCSFSVTGTGRFLPGNHANPYIGEKGKMEEVKEVRIETIYPKRLEKKILTAMLKAHPYEEVAYDLYPLENKGKILGLGRIGKLKEEMTLREFAHFVKTQLEVEGVRVVGNLESKVRKVAVLGGDGNKFYQSALFKGADVYVTGDMYYHTAHDAMMAGLNIIDPGHNVEKVMKKGVANKLSAISAEKGYDVEFIPSKVRTDPFQFL